MSTKPPRVNNLTLCRGWEDRGCYVWSPFVTKLELRLRLSRVPYIAEAGSLSTAPKGKIPYIELQQPNEGPPLLLGDSTLIIKRLVELEYLQDLATSLSASTRAHDLALRALLEEKLYFYHTRERWLDNYYIHRDKTLWTIPYPVRVVVGLLVHRKVSQFLHGQGTGRYTADEIRGFRQEIWEAVNGLLLESKARQRQSQSQSRPPRTDGSDDDEPFWCLGGTAPTDADATLYGFVVSVLVSASGPESTKLVRSFPVILDYAGRIHDKYFPDYTKWE